jgi:hypothetical protein
MAAKRLHATLEELFESVFSVWFAAAAAARKGVFRAILPEAISRGPKGQANQ